MAQAVPLLPPEVWSLIVGKAPSINYRLWSRFFDDLYHGELRCWEGRACSNPGALVRLAVRGHPLIGPLLTIPKVHAAVAARLLFFTELLELLARRGCLEILRFLAGRCFAPAKEGESRPNENYTTIAVGALLGGQKRVYAWALEQNGKAFATPTFWMNVGRTTHQDMVRELGLEPAPNRTAFVIKGAAQRNDVDLITELLSKPGSGGQREWQQRLEGGMVGALRGGHPSLYWHLRAKLVGPLACCGTLARSAGQLGQPAIIADVLSFPQPTGSLHDQVAEGLALGKHYGMLESFLAEHKKHLSGKTLTRIARRRVPYHVHEWLLKEGCAASAVLESGVGQGSRKVMELALAYNPETFGRALLLALMVKKFDSADFLLTERPALLGELFTIGTHFVMPYLESKAHSAGLYPSRLRGASGSPCQEQACLLLTKVLLLAQESSVRGSDDPKVRLRARKITERIGALQGHLPGEEGTSTAEPPGSTHLSPPLPVGKLAH